MPVGLKIAMQVSAQCSNQCFQPPRWAALQGSLGTSPSLASFVHNSCTRRLSKLYRALLSFLFRSTSHADCHLAKQYLEFWRDVRGLAENLDILSSVITQADNSLQRERQSVKTRVRWDRRSLIEIVGDYDGTLRECRELLDSNTRYRGGSGPLRNLEWNILVQPTADRLRQRIILHNSKVLHILKPFEM